MRERLATGRTFSGGVLRLLGTLFLVQVVLAGCSNQTGPSEGPGHPSQQTGAPDGGVTVILNMSIGPGANQFKVQVVVLSVGGGRPLQGVIVTLLTTAGRIAPPRGSTDVAGIFNAILTCDDSGAASIVTAAAEGVVVQDTRCGTPAPPVTSGEPEPNPLTPPAKS
jgi:hypothetical protein